MRVSIHAPAWGATQACKQFHLLPSVSIHAPAWGATQPFAAKMGLPLKFQSTRPRGARHFDVLRATGGNGFQSTRPRGARPQCQRFRARRLRVSIHAPAWGATWQSGKVVNPSQVSIHAPAWGATVSFILYAQVCAVSIHAPAWGATAAVAPAHQ